MKKYRVTLFMSEAGIKALKLLSIEYNKTVSNFIEETVTSELVTLRELELSKMKKRKKLVIV